MATRKRKMTPREKAEKKRRRREYMTIFIHGKQKRVKRPPTVEGTGVDEFIRNNADALWYHQNEMWENIQVDEEMSHETAKPNQRLHATAAVVAGLKGRRGA